MTGPGNVAVTQADREAAAVLVYEMMRGGLNWSSAKRIRDTIREGKWDAHYAVQALARHRQSHTDLLAAAREAILTLTPYFTPKHGVPKMPDRAKLEKVRTTLASIDAALGKQDTQES